MQSNSDENHAVWQDADALEWELPLANLPPRAGEDSLVEEEIDTDNLLILDTESDQLPWTRPALIDKETLRTFARQFSPILVPLPFALLIFLFTLPATLQGPPAHPTTLVMGLLLLGVLLLQGTLLYFAGSNDTLWMLYIACGYALFIASGVFAVFGTVAALIMLGILFVVGLILAQRGIHPTKEGSVDLVESFGKYTHTLYPGLNLLMPWERVAQRLNTQETTWTCPQQRVPTSREQNVQLTATISYQLQPEDAYLAAVTVKNWEGNLQTLFVGTVQSLVNELSPADFVSWTQSIYTTRAGGENSSFNPAAATRWDRINSALSRRMQDQVASWGVQINWVRIQDITLLPNTPVALIAPVPGDNDAAGTTEIIKPEPPIVVPAKQLSAQSAKDIPPAVSAGSAPQTKSTLTEKVPRVETLKDMYNAVRQGVITDPKVILDIALRFESLAADPATSKILDFDAGRAAGTLRQRAQKLQELAQTRP